MKTLMRLNFATKVSAALWMASLVFPSTPLQAQIVTIPSTYALPASTANTAKPGFVWRIHQTAASLVNTTARTDAQLAGELGVNIADPNVNSIATGPADAPSPDTAPISFDVETVINMDPAGGSNGNFTPDDQMPGMPGLTGVTTYVAGEALTWIELPAGEITMGVNSDDGFRLTIGGPNPSDRFLAIKVGEYEGGRSPADSIFTFKTEKAGLYAARLIWQNGTGGSAVEWFSVKSDGTMVLINDSANQGFKAYRAITSSPFASVNKVSPTQNAAGVSPISPIHVELTEGATALDLSNVKLSIDGTVVSAAAARSGKTVTIDYQPATAFAKASVHKVTLAYSDGTPTSVQWSFTVANFATLSPSFKVTPDTTKPGFIWNVFANSANTSANNARAENALAGLLVDGDNNPLDNYADPAARGAAIANATVPNPSSAPVRFEIASVINVSQSSDDNQNGNFKPDQQMPGIPSITGENTGIAAEILTFLELPAGIITMGINSDEGFRTTAGTPKDVFNGLVLGEFDGARTATDTLFTFAVQEAGTYAFRTLYQNGTGPANIEWFTVKTDGTKVLVGDTANGGVKAYRATSTAQPPYIASVSPSPVPRQTPATTSSIIVKLADGTNPVDDASIVLKLDGKTLAPEKSRQNNAVTLTYAVKTLVTPEEQHTAELTFKDSAGGSTRTQSWKFYNLKNIVLPTAAIFENFDSYDEGSVPTGWDAINFTTTVTEGEDLDNLKSDSYKGWIVVSRARLAVLKSRIFNVAPDQTVNGEPVTSLSDGNLLYAESDVRGGNQVQFITTKPYDLTKVTNVVLSFSSLYEQNQDNIGAVEYSVDGGKNWMPVVYYLDYLDGGGDIKLNDDGTVDAIKTLTGANSDTANWTNNGVALGDKYGDAILAPITQALGSYVAPRANDNNTVDKRVEVFHLPLAGKQADVRLRFAQIGTGSWYFGVDNLGFYEGPAPVSSPSVQATLNTPVVSGNSITLSWTGSGTLEEASSIKGPWTTSGIQTNPHTVTNTGTKFYRIKQ